MKDVTWDKEKCPLSVLTSVHNKQVLYGLGVHIKQVSIEQGLSFNFWLFNYVCFFFFLRVRGKTFYQLFTWCKEKIH